MAQLAAALGTPLQPWQRQVVDVALEVLPDGSWAYRTVTVSTPRQSGKTTLVGPVHLHRAMTRRWTTFLTAQKRQDARATWLDVAKRLGKSPLAPYATVRESNGSEVVEWPSGGSFAPFAPSEDALHGKANELVTVDEGWAFDLAQGVALEQAIGPTFTTTAGQLWMPSTAGHGGSHWLRGYVDRGRAAVEADHREGHAHFEWALTPLDAQRVAQLLDDDQHGPAVDVVLASHPGRLVKRAAVLEDAHRMSPDQFLRAYGNVWTEAQDRVIPAHVWDAAAVQAHPAQPLPGSLALAFDVAVDRSDAAVLAAWRDTPGGTMRVEVIDHREGSSWLTGELRRLAERWRPVGIGYDRAGPGVAVADELARGGLTLQPTNGAEYAAACVAFLSAVTDRRLAHPARPSLDDAVGAAATRPLGDGGWAWARRASSSSIAPLVAATLACWTYDHRPAPAPRPVIAVSRRRVSTPR